MAKDLWVPIFVHALFTVHEAQRMSLAQAAAETRESDLLRDPRCCYHQLPVCSELCLAREHRSGQVAFLGRVVGPLAVVCLIDTF